MSRQQGPVTRRCVVRRVGGRIRRYAHDVVLWLVVDDEPQQVRPRVVPHAVRHHLCVVDLVQVDVAVDEPIVCGVRRLGELASIGAKDGSATASAAEHEAALVCAALPLAVEAVALGGQRLVGTQQVRAPPQGVHAAGCQLVGLGEDGPGFDATLVFTVERPCCDVDLLSLCVGVVLEERLQVFCAPC